MHGTQEVYIGIYIGSVYRKWRNVNQVFSLIVILPHRCSKGMNNGILYLCSSELMADHFIFILAMTRLFFPTFHQPSLVLEAG